MFPETNIRWFRYAAVVAFVTTTSASRGTAQCVSAGDPSLWPHYSIVDLGTLGRQESGAYGISPTGLVTGYAWSRYSKIPVAFQGGVATALETMGGPESIAMSANAQGDIVGWSERQENDHRAVLWQDGQMVDLGLEQAYARSVNSFGQIAGRTRNRPCVWDDGVLWDLGRFGKRRGSASAINDVGQVVGRSFVDGEYHPVLWQNGQMIDLGTLGGRRGWANDINDQGVVVGWYELPERRDFRGSGFICENGVMRDLGIPDRGGCFDTNPNAINNSGWVVGESSWGGFLWRDGEWVTLRSLVQSDDWRCLTYVNDINDAGPIVGRGFILDGITRHAFLMTPYSCDAIEGIEATWSEDGHLRVRVESSLVQGTALNVRLALYGKRPVFMDEYGQGEVVWEVPFGSYTLCLEECPGVCADVAAP